MKGQVVGGHERAKAQLGKKKEEESKAHHLVNSHGLTRITMHGWANKSPALLAADLSYLSLRSSSKYWGSGV